MNDKNQFSLFEYYFFNKKITEVFHFCTMQFLSICPPISNVFLILHPQKYPLS